MDGWLPPGSLDSLKRSKPVVATVGKGGMLMSDYELLSIILAIIAIIVRVIIALINTKK